MDAIKKEMFRKRIWISIHDITVVKFRCIAYTIIGVLNIYEPGKIFLITSNVLETLQYVRFMIKVLFTI